MRRRNTNNKTTASAATRPPTIGPTGTGDDVGEDDAEEALGALVLIMPFTGFSLFFYF